MNRTITGIFKGRLEPKANLYLNGSFLNVKII